MSLDIIDVELSLPGICCPESKNTNVIVIGCGGTGGYFIRDALRFMSEVQEKGRMKFKPVLIDGDSVEKKNISRQNFVYNDIGKNKAQVLATRYSKAFGIDVAFIDQYFDDSVAEKIIDSINFNYNLIILSFVDNVTTRKYIHNLYVLLISKYYDYHTHSNQEGTPNIFYIDAGNLEYGGQVVVSSAHTAIVKNFATECFHHFTPTPDVFSIHKDLLSVSDSIKQQESCAEAAEVNPQTICANLTSANVSLSVFYNIVNQIVNNSSNSFLPYNEIYFDSQTARSTPVMLKTSECPKIVDFIVK